MTEDFNPPAPDSPDRVVHDTMKDRMQEIGGLIHRALPAGCGFSLFLFQYGPGGWLTYISTADRDDTRDMLAEWAVKTTPPRTEGPVEVLVPDRPAPTVVWHEGVTQMRTFVERLIHDEADRGRPAEVLRTLARLLDRMRTTELPVPPYLQGA